MSGPLAPLFAQLGGTLEFLREIENGKRCGTCQRPLASDEDWGLYDEGEGDHLCWETVCSHEPESPTALERLMESRAALSSIERHVQDMAEALAIAPTHPTPEGRAIIEKAFAALSVPADHGAREGSQEGEK